EHTAQRTDVLAEDDNALVAGHFLAQRLAHRFDHREGAGGLTTITSCLRKRLDHQVDGIARLSSRHRGCQIWPSRRRTGWSVGCSPVRSPTCSIITSADTAASNASSEAIARLRCSSLNSG